MEWRANFLITGVSKCVGWVLWKRVNSNCRCQNCVYIVCCFVCIHLYRDFFVVVKWKVCLFVFMSSITYQGISPRIHINPEIDHHNQLNTLKKVWTTNTGGIKVIVSGWLLLLVRSAITLSVILFIVRRYYSAYHHPGKTDIASVRYHPVPTTWSSIIIIIIIIIDSSLSFPDDKTKHKQ